VEFLGELLAHPQGRRMRVKQAMDPTVRERGFTLIELLVAVSLFAFLIALAVPMYTDFLGNSQVRNAAEAMLNGVLWTQSAAINANTQVQLVVTPATGWTIAEVNPDLSVRTPILPAPFQLSDGAPNAHVVPTPPGATEITFDAFGRIVANPDASPTISCIDVTNSQNANARALRVVITNATPATATKLCDPLAAATEPQACPAALCQ
jgi:type IV fimbrial biogenesis protein FimT